jgi:hypothetical protein
LFSAQYSIVSQFTECELGTVEAAMSGNGELASVALTG